MRYTAKSGRLEPLDHTDKALRKGDILILTSSRESVKITSLCKDTVWLKINIVATCYGNMEFTRADCQHLATFFTALANQLED